MGDFVDEGSAYAFEVGTPGAGAAPATLTIIPPSDRRTPMRTALVVSGREVPQSESLSSAEDSLVAGSVAVLSPRSAAPGSGGSSPSLVRQGSFKIKS